MSERSRAGIMVDVEGSAGGGGASGPALGQGGEIAVVEEGGVIRVADWRGEPVVHFGCLRRRLRYEESFLWWRGMEGTCM
jgi:hypothetical protein